jgi:hypothetical protein
MEHDFRSKIDESYPPLISIMLENMLKQNQKERWSYDDLTKFGKISKHFSEYTGLSHDDKLGEEI